MLMSGARPLGDRAPSGTASDAEDATIGGTGVPAQPQSVALGEDAGDEPSPATAAASAGAIPNDGSKVGDGASDSHSRRSKRGRNRRRGGVPAGAAQAADYDTAVLIVGKSTLVDVMWQARVPAAKKLCGILPYSDAV